jgi:hypothetical protein
MIKKESRTERLQALRNKMREDSSPKSNQKQDDTRFWKAERDVAGQGSAILRFLPAKAGEAFPYVQRWSHGFQGPTNKWFIDLCPTSIGENCPVCKANTILWNSGSDTNTKLASSRKRKLSYISNIVVVNDPKHTENNGKVCLYQYGKKIFDMVKEMVDPEFADSHEPIDVFDAEEGSNFKLRITKKDGFPNYDKSEFDTTTSAIGDEDQIAEFLGQCYSLNELVDPSHFKSFADLKKRFDMVTGESSGDETSDKPELTASTEEAPVSKPTPTTTKANVAKAKAEAEGHAVAVPLSDDSDDFFANLAKQSSTA